MQRLTVSLNPAIKADFTANDWELFSSMSGAKMVAKMLNRALERYVHDGLPRSAVADNMYGVMQQYARFGAVDTEPLNFLDRVLDEIYGS